MNKRNPTKRREDIIQLLSEHGQIKISELSQQLSTSVVTIRSDCNILEADGIISKKHGMIKLSKRNSQSGKFNNLEQKQAIAIAAAKRIPDNSLVLMDGGSTVLELAKKLGVKKDLSITTNNVEIAYIMAQNPYLKSLKMLGGDVSLSSMNCTDMHSDLNIKNMYFDILAIGVDGIDVEAGLTTNKAINIDALKHMQSVSNKVYVLFDSSKIGKRSYYQIADLPDIDLVITDDQAPDDFIDALRDLGIEVIQAKL